MLFCLKYVIKKGTAWKQTVPYNLCIALGLFYYYLTAVADIHALGLGLAFQPAAVEPVPVASILTVSSDIPDTCCR